MDAETQFKILIQILEKKKAALEVILNVSENQEALLESPPDEARASMFKAMSDEKQKHIDEILHLDNVFQTGFDPLRQEIEDNPKKWRKYLVDMQIMIDDVLELDVKIRAQETKNRTIITEQMPHIKQPKPVISEAAKRELLHLYKQNSKK
ncbi:MAG: hypothetical protein LBM16_01875 [Clostridiales bacterium]|jgi:hypothetical protein|nr:hypothetical protein [Clostridiales bacterium]